MKAFKLFSVFTLMLTLLMNVALAEVKTDDQYNSIVIVEVQGLTQESYTDLVEKLNKDNNISVEYGCAWSDVVIIKLHNSTLKNRGDVQTLIKGKVEKVLQTKEIKFLHIKTVSVGGASKC